MIRRLLRSALDRSLESKTLQSLAPLVEKDLHQVITSDTLSRELLVELFSHRCAAVRVPNFYPAEMVPVMRERLLASSHRTNWKVSDPQRGLENSTVESVGTPLVAAALAILVVVLFYHVQLGIQVILEDYVHGGLKIASLILLNFSCISLVFIGLFSIIKVSL